MGKGKRIEISWCVRVPSWTSTLATCHHVGKTKDRSRERERGRESVVMVGGKHWPASS